MFAQFKFLSKSLLILDKYWYLSKIKRVLDKNLNLRKHTNNKNSCGGAYVVSISFYFYLRFHIVALFLIFYFVFNFLFKICSRHMKFWSFRRNKNNDSSLNVRAYSMGRVTVEAPKIQNCIVFLNSSIGPGSDGGVSVLSGGDNGGLYMWTGGTYGTVCSTNILFYFKFFLSFFLVERNFFCVFISY